MFKLKSERSIGNRLKGVFTTSPTYEVRVPDANWSPFFGHYENQRWGQWDSDSCWALSCISCIEDQLEWLWKNNMFSDEAKKFFTDNGYIDSDGDFSISERFLEIISGARDNGNNQMNAWILAQKNGLIPRSLLNYSLEQAQLHLTKADFDADYFNTKNITQAMLDLGKKFLTYVKIERQWIGTLNKTPDLQVLQAALRQTPLQIGIPVPSNQWMWNNPRVEYEGGTNADHAVELYAIDAQGQYLIFDQYEPHLKVLSANYFLPFVTQGILIAVPQMQVNPIPQSVTWNTVWQAVLAWLNGTKT